MIDALVPRAAEPLGEGDLRRLKRADLGHVQPNRRQADEIVEPLQASFHPLDLFANAGHFTLREDWSLREFPEMLRLYSRALKRVDAGWLNAFGWSNIGIERYFDEYFGRTAHLNRIVSIGGFSADEVEQLIETVNERAKPGEIAAVELNASCHNVNFPFETILERLRRAPEKRPLFSSPEQARALFEQRRSLYAGADIHCRYLGVDPPSQVARELVGRLAARVCAT